MKKIRISKRPYCIMICGILFALLFQGCFNGPGSSSAFKASSTKNTKSKAITNIDKDIDFTKGQIAGYKEFRTQSLQQAVINDVKNNKSRGWILGDGNPTFEEIADRDYANAAAAEKEIERLGKKLDRLENKKRKILKQSTGCFLPHTLVKMEDGTLKSLEQLQPGQKVLTYDIGYDKLVSKPVIEVYTVKANHLYKINNQLSATGGERLLSQNGWEKIRNLKKGDFVHLDGSMVKIENIDYVRLNHTLYNIQVADTHNFYVVTKDGSAFLVHNSGGGGK